MMQGRDAQPNAHTDALNRSEIRFFECQIMRIRVQLWPERRVSLF